MTRPQFSPRIHRARAILAAVAKAYPDAWEQSDSFRAMRGTELPSWPDWCYLPLAGGYAIASGGGNLPHDRLGHPAIITALAAWRMTLGVYRIDPGLYPALIDTPIAGDIPTDPIYRLPEWCIYIETPDLTWAGAPVYGAWAHLEADQNGGPDELRLLLDMARDPDSPLDGLDPVPIILGNGGLAEALERLQQSAERNAAQAGVRIAAHASRYAEIAAPILSIVLYIASQAGEITGKGQPGNPTPVRTRRDGWRLFPAQGLRTWDVGTRIGAALRAAYQAEQTGTGGERAGPRPHVRRAHWHTILSGPRDAERRRELRWMPPIPVGITDTDAMPTVVRPVR